MADTPVLRAYLPRILRYPLSGHALPALLMFTLFLWLGLQTIFGIALLAIVSPWVFHYAEAVIERTAQGQATPPQFGGDMIYLGGLAALRPLIGIALILGGWYTASRAGPGPAAAVLAVGVFLFPAFMLLLVVQNSLAAALNPLQWVQLILGAGLAYPAVCLVLAAAAAGAVLLSSQAGLAVTLFVLIYTWLMVCHLLGYVAFHRAEKLGLDVKPHLAADERTRQEQQQARMTALLAKIDAALAANNLQAAGDALYAEPGGPASVLLFHEELFQQMERRRNASLLHAQGQRLITLLIQHKRAAQALDAAEICFDAHPDFAPAAPEQAVLLAEQALLAKRLGLFERLVRNSDTRYARQPAAVSLAFLRAKYWYENQRDENKARETLKPLLAETQHPQHRQIAAYARALGAPTLS
jgi:hypothetical protein